MWFPVFHSREKDCNFKEMDNFKFFGSSFAPESVGKRQAIISVGLLFWLINIAMLLYASLIRDFNPDEYEHLHAAWYVFNGAIPFKDFIEHQYSGNDGNNK